MTQSRTLAQVVNRVDATETDTTTNATNITSNDVQLARGGNHGKNLIINGDFSVWQRGVSFNNSGNIYTADRWSVETGSATPTVTKEVHAPGQTDVPNNPESFLKITKNAASTKAEVNHKIENVGIASGQEVTLVVYYDSSSTPVLNVFQNFGSGGSTQVQAEAETAFTLVSTSGAWKKYSVTITLPSISGKTVGTSSYTLFRIAETSSSTNDVSIANVQLEFGDTATDFEYVNPADQLARCKRYFERIQSVSSDETILGFGHATSTTAATCYISYTEKRARPSSITGSATAADFLTRATDGVLRSATWSAAYDITSKTAGIEVTRDSGSHVVGDTLFLLQENITTAYIDVDAEL